jgi:hypothetical protein
MYIAQSYIYSKNISIPIVEYFKKQPAELLRFIRQRTLILKIIQTGSVFSGLSKT